MAQPAVPRNHSYDVDFAIITALPHEAQAVVSRLENHHTEKFEHRNIRHVISSITFLQKGGHPCNQGTWARFCWASGSS
jgi:hypothetical protein